MNAPVIQVLRGNPSDDEVAALTAVLTQLDADARAKAAQTKQTRDLWTKPGHQFNPSAFRNVRYY